MSLYVAVRFYHFDAIDEINRQALNKMDIGDRRVHLKDERGSRPVGFLPVYESVTEANAVTHATGHLVKKLANVNDIEL